MSKRAILFLNLGGPETLKDVKPFLFRLFADPEIITIPFKPLRLFVAWLISTTREKKSQGLYEKIGGGSPIRRLTDDQAAKVKEGLKKNGMDAFVETAFTCSNPLVEDVIQNLYDKGVRTFLSFPLYPQYSYTTTRSSIDRVRMAVKKYAPDAKLEEIRSWPDHPKFVEAHVDLIREDQKKIKGVSEKETYLIFSAHSIPEKLVTEKGDPYKSEMWVSVKAIVKKMNWQGPWLLTWQSKLGPVKWLAPATSDTVKLLGKKGAKAILLDPIAFVTDHIETLEELDGEIAEEARESGVGQFVRVPGLNSHPSFIESLVDIAQNKKEFWN